ncbi:MAG: HEAT repeat domain-containing protein [Victivallaceae bacterium]|nr:HEAT repeat domain-containing protein [Victivallaceae bacterium]
MTYSYKKLSKKLKTMLWMDFRKGVMKEQFSKLAIASLLLQHSNIIEMTQILKKFDGEDLSEAPEDKLYEFARALALHKGKLVDKILIHLLRDNENNSVRAQAAESLSGRKSKAVRKALEYAEKYEAYPNVRKAVKKALESINDGQNKKSGSAVKAAKNK